MSVDDRDVYVRAGDAMAPNDRRSGISGRVRVTPGAQSGEHGHQVSAGPGQVVVAADAVTGLAVRAPLEHARCDEAFEAVSEHSLRHPQNLLELDKARTAFHGFPHDEQRPALTHGLQRAGDRAVTADLQ